ncbi:MAG: BON domain-containing protein [Ardenticatenia bacterium]|nr:BON domain-containing protein [Ardenticatenia bacterium]
MSLQEHRPMILASPHLEPIEHPSEHLRQNLSTAVEGALWRYDPIRQTRTSIAVSEQDGVITLDGNIRGEMMKSVAGRIATGVTGVRRVINHLIADSGSGTRDFDEPGDGPGSRDHDGQGLDPGDPGAGGAGRAGVRSDAGGGGWPQGARRIPGRAGSGRPVSRLAGAGDRGR